MKFRLQNSRIFCKRKRRVKYSNERSGASVETARENGERRRACEARAFHTNSTDAENVCPNSSQTQNSSGRNMSIQYKNDHYLLIIMF